MFTSGHMTKMAVTTFDPLYPTQCCMQTSRLCVWSNGSYWQSKFYICGNRNFLPFWLLWPWPWPDDLHIWTRPVVHGDIPHVHIWTSYVKAFESYHLADIQTRGQTDTTKTITHAASQVVKMGIESSKSRCRPLLNVADQLIVCSHRCVDLLGGHQPHPWDCQ